MNAPRGFLDEPEQVRASEPKGDTRPERGWIAGSAEATGPVRHDDSPILPAPSSKIRWQPALLGIAALSFIVVTIALLELLNFVFGQFSQGITIGALTVGLIIPAFSILVWACLQEWQSFFSMGTIDEIRLKLASDNLQIVREGAEEWLDAVGATVESKEAILGANDPATLKALLRSGPIAKLDAASSSAGRTAALQVLAATAVCPWPGMDGMVVIWRGLRLVKQVAELHGLRPGASGTIRLFYRVTTSAATVVAADAVVSAIAENLLGSAMEGTLAGQAAGSAIAGRRMLQLSLAVANNCRPL